ncbi:MULTISPECIES: (deoxy)nucleoside triphosphate pyrophosphohydrolase [unclassified Corynebacterium]|uniref:(deoxy)nucleoside triphosphate pyrophosphohydrolase n=1 Tax=unclassified Corynebacterium TaxID=2624378 RepID=UPI00264C6757|nr:MULTISPECIES: (deoxy)nucleoside triphosphate pyrophosphohydrolase [unclassified Corynebacterium]MDN8594834.1 (deoxy)nucleoside triphosphate pyrophosphohydrolase [Corynebacterium sp. P4_F2]WKK56318.1 (deoxy)nucleoside triphosphate pyrophosphohydrolase [Corynebacterium sp. P4-C1]WKK63751.1 (deoxy)nucleoside triphosphate pyrophosphohydrolase [Corynebacterium sp. P8-C1]
MSKLIDVTGAVIIRDGAVFAAQRGPGKALAGKWEFPGGKIEPGETPEQSLARELKEELLVDAAVHDHITTTEYTYDFGTVRLSTFHCTLAPGTEPTLTEHADSRWVPLTELTDLDWAPADIPAVELIAK